MNIEPSGEIVISVSGTGTEVTLVDDGLLVRNWELSVELAFDSGKVKPRTTTASGYILVGGDDGFEAFMRGVLDTEAGTATLAIEHPGGWSPLPGFVTPAFTGSVAFGVGGTRLALYALAQWGEPTAVVPELLRFVGHPSSGSAGASVQVNLSQATNESDAVYEVRFEGGLELGSGTGAPPVLGVRGVVHSGGEASLQLETDTQWSPLGGDLLALPAMQGDLTVSGGLVSVSVAAAADHVDIVPDLLALRAAVFY